MTQLCISFLSVVPVLTPASDIYALLYFSDTATRCYALLYSCTYIAPRPIMTISALIQQQHLLSKFSSLDKRLYRNP